MLLLLLKDFFDPDKNTLADIPSLYKDYINKLDEPKIITFIKEIAKYAKLYREKILSFDRSSLFSYDNVPQRLFHILSQCEISTFTPIFFHYTLNTTMLILFQNFVNLKIYYS